MGLYGRTLPMSDPLAVKFDLCIDQSHRVRPSADRFFGAEAVIRQQGSTLPQCCVPLLDEARVLAHLRNRHTGEAQALHQAQPADVVFGVDASAPWVPAHTRDESLRLVPTDRVNAAPGSVGYIADVQFPWHGSRVMS